jgi:hypothetical protein
MIVALYKVWRGEEFMEASLASIYYHVGAILVLSSEISWNGVKGNTVKPVVEKWKKENDHYDKIKIVDFDSLSQDAQYQFGVQLIRKIYPNCTWIMIVDTDEIWDDENLLRAKNKYLKFSRGIGAYRTRHWGCVKSLLYAVEDDGRAVQPMVFVRSDCQFRGVRGSASGPSITMEDVTWFHASMIRKTEQDVFDKIKTSTIGDINVKCTDLTWWKINVWDKIPNVENFHYTIGFEYVWKRIRKIKVEDLPPTLRNHPLLEGACK